MIRGRTYIFDSSYISDVSSHFDATQKPSPSLQSFYNFLSVGGEYLSTAERAISESTFAASDQDAGTLSGLMLRFLEDQSVF